MHGYITHTDLAAYAADRVNVSLHDDLGLRIILASNTQPGESRWPALQKAGIDDLFRVVLLSYPLGVGKPAPLFYRLVLAAAEAPPDQVLLIGDDLENDVAAPITHGMRAALIQHVRDLPALLEDM